MDKPTIKNAMKAASVKMSSINRRVLNEIERGNDDWVKIKVAIETAEFFPMRISLNQIRRALRCLEKMKLVVCRDGRWMMA